MSVISGHFSTVYRRFRSSFPEDKAALDVPKYKAGDDEERFIPGYDIDDITYEDKAGVKLTIYEDDNREKKVLNALFGLNYLT